MPRERLSLGELGSATGCFETVFLPLLHPGVTGQEACLLEDRTIIGIDIEKSTGDTVTDSTGLTGIAAAVNINEDVKLAEGVGELEGSTNDHLEGFISKVIVEISLVDDDFAGAGNETYTGNGAFTPAGSKILSGSCHDIYLLPKLLEYKDFGLLGFMLVVGSCINANLGEHLPAEGSLGHHAANGLIEKKFGLLCKKITIFGLLESAGIAGVMVVDLLIQLVAGHNDLISVDDDNVITAVNVRGVDGLVFATEY